MVAMGLSEAAIGGTGLIATKLTGWIMGRGRLRLLTALPRLSQLMAMAPRS